MKAEAEANVSQFCGADHAPFNAGARADNWTPEIPSPRVHRQAVKMRKDQEVKEKFRASGPVKYSSIYDVIRRMNCTASIF